jgi:glutathione-regulated potassium-efflux system protein KefB
MSIDLNRVMAEPELIAAGVGVLLLVKMAVLVGIGWRPGNLRKREALMLGAVLALGGEFAFVVFGEAFRAQLIDAVLRDRLVAIVSLSMAATPLLVIAVAQLLKTHPEQKEERPADTIAEGHPRVIIAGFGRMGQIVGRMLRAQKIDFIALEHSPEQVALSRRFGTLVYFGDPSKPELLRAAHAERAEVMVITTDDADTTVRTARLVRRLYPNLRVFARARNRQHAFRLMDLGVEIIRETFHSSLVMGQKVMEELGVPHDVAYERRERFREHDERMLREQHLVYDDEAALIASSEQSRRELETLFEADAMPERDAVTSVPEGPPRDG